MCAVCREAATYAGTIPCADCPGQRVVLTLFPDFTFRLRQTYLEATNGRDEDFYALGRWAHAQDDGDRLRLRGGKERGWHFRFLAGEQLRMLDNEGNEARSGLNYDLARQRAVDPVAGPTHLRVMYVYMADATGV
ncbi:MAG: copper resistance protein NlpE N-terminal domain-containing protein [Burkholderiales bacterium]